MADPALVAEIKQIMALAKSGDTDGANARYGALFASPEFAGYPVQDQRQALGLLILAKRKTAPSASFIETHRAAIPILARLFEDHAEPADAEMLGICYQLSGYEAEAAATFRAGLDSERTRNPDSDLCGRLMKHFSSI
jgi:hypothetical protein